MKPHPSVVAALLLIALSCAESPTLGPDTFCDSSNPCTGDPAFPKCDPFNHRCVSAETMVGAACTRDAECQDPATPVCDAHAHACARCSSPDDDGSCLAHGGGLSRCQVETGRCGACRVDSAASDCSVMAPVCDEGACRGCRGQGECPTSVCLADGRCAPEADVVYVDNHGKPCDGPMHAGTRADPYCEISDAVANLGKRTAIRVAASTVAYHRFDTAKAGSAPLLIQGAGLSAQPSSRISDASGSCVDVNVNTDVTFDGLELTGCKGGLYSNLARTSLLRCLIHHNSSVGVTLSSGTALQIVDGSIIRDNVGGGLEIRFTKYDVRNSYIARNVMGAFGGVFIDQASTGRFAFNTVRDNGTKTAPGGVECEGAVGGTVLEASIVYDNLLGMGRQIGTACKLKSVVTNKADEAQMVEGAIYENPSFEGSDYRLMRAPYNGKLIDAVANGMDAFDVDGTPRPQGKGWDIGCFEVKPEMKP